MIMNLWPNIIRMINPRQIRWTWHVARMGAKRNVCRIVVGTPGGKRPLGRPRRRQVDNIKMDLREIGCGGMGSIDLAQGRDQWRALVNTSPWCLREAWCCLDILSFKARDL
jgi:hypothetical protein